MKRINSESKIFFYIAIVSSLALITLISLTIVRLEKIEIPKITYRDIVFWLTEVN